MQISHFYSISDNLNQEFYTRIKYNFKLHVFVCMEKVNLDREYILQEICTLEGYQQHKCVKYDGKWSHIIIKFMEEKQAENAVIHFLSSRFSVSCVDDLLRGWFNFELSTGHCPTQTLTVVDILGTPPKSLNFLTENLLNCVLKDFGQPFVTPYTAAIKKTHVQVMFHSMTEAFAACIALGFWYRLNRRMDNFAYRVRINPSVREASLIISTGGTPDVAFMYDWFINSKSDINAEKRKGDSKIQTSQFKRDAFLKRKDRKQNSTLDRLQPSQITMPSVFRTPVMCVPVITPMNGTCTPTFVVAGQQVEDMANTFLLHPAFIESGEHRPLPLISDPGMRVYASSSPCGNPERFQSCSYQEESSQVYLGEQLRAPIQASTSPGHVSMQRISHQSVEYQSVYRENSLSLEHVYGD